MDLRPSLGSGGTCLLFWNVAIWELIGRPCRERGSNKNVLFWEAPIECHRWHPDPGPSISRYDWFRYRKLEGDYAILWYKRPDIQMIAREITGDSCELIGRKRINPRTHCFSKQRFRRKGRRYWRESVRQHDGSPQWAIFSGFDRAEDRT